MITYLKVETPDDYDLASLAEDLQVPDYIKLYQYDPGEKFGTAEREKEWILKVGLTNALKSEKVFEHLVVPRASITDTAIIYKIFLETTVQSDQLIIIDNYFFNESDDVYYPNLILSIFQDLIPKLNKITFIITDQDRFIKISTKQAIETLFKGINPGLLIETHKSDQFHDRFVLGNPNGKGIFNRFAHKYSVVDYLDQNDTAELYDELRRTNLI